MKLSKKDRNEVGVDPWCTGTWGIRKSDALTVFLLKKTKK